MGAVVIIIVLPSPQFLTGIVQRNEFVDVEELITQPPVERLDQSIIRGLARSRVIELDAPAICPLVQGLGRKLRAVVTAE